jgi:hypothetical protein
MVIFWYSESDYRMVQFSDAQSYQIGPVFERSTSLDRFINKIHKKYFILDKTV